MHRVHYLPLMLILILLRWTSVNYFFPVTSVLCTLLFNKIILYINSIYLHCNRTCLYASSTCGQSCNVSVLLWVCASVHASIALSTVNLMFLEVLDGFSLNLQHWCILGRGEHVIFWGLKIKILSHGVIIFSFNFSFTAPTIWNELPTIIRESNTLNTFKRRLKTHLTSLTTRNV